MPTGHDYRIFVGAFPTGDLADRIQAVRLRYDAKTARITAPHVTIAGTYWRSGPPTPANEAATIERLKAIGDRLKPFEMIVGGVESFLPDTPVIYLHIEPTDGLLAARGILLDAIEPDKHRHFAPHLTLTMRLDHAKTQSLLNELRRSEWHSRRWRVLIDHLWLMQRGPGDPAWRYIHSIACTG
jgi:2'-5' RNA ligase